MGDGDQDIYVVNDKMQNDIGNVLWRNDGAGCGHWCWTNASGHAGADLLINGMGVDAADYDNDGDLDLYVTDMVYTMYLLRNDDGAFRSRAYSTGVAINYGPDSGVGWGAVFFDYDNDGWQDLYVASTEYFQSFPELETTFMNPRADALFRNSGNNKFEDVSARSGVDEALPTLGVAYADYDMDGDLDLVTGNWNSGYRLYQNQGERNRWLSIDLRGDVASPKLAPRRQRSAPAVNRDAVGTRVYATTPDGTTQMQTVRIGAGLGGNNQLALHFGLGLGFQRRPAHRLEQRRRMSARGGAGQSAYHAPIWRDRRLRLGLPRPKWSGSCRGETAARPLMSKRCWNRATQRVAPTDVSLADGFIIEEDARTQRLPQRTSVSRGTTSQVS